MVDPEISEGDVLIAVFVRIDVSPHLVGMFA
jgi:hypothetical protein